MGHGKKLQAMLHVVIHYFPASPIIQQVTAVSHSLKILDTSV